MSEQRKICIYCLRSESDGMKFGKAHVFPKSIGGLVWIGLCCNDCNSVIGRTIEAEVYDSLYLTFGLDKLELNEGHRAFRHIPTTDTVTGEECKYFNGVLSSAPRIDPSGRKVGPENTVIQMWLGEVRKKLNPDWADYCEQQYRMGETSIRVPGGVHKLTKVVSREPTTFTGTNAVPVDLIAKIAWESMFLSGFLTPKIMNEFYSSTFRPEFVKGQVKRIDVGSSFERRLGCLPHPVFQNEADYDTLDYQPYHRLDFRVTKAKTAYVRMTFFGDLTYLIVVGKTDASDLVKPEVLGRAFIFKIGDDAEKLIADEYPDHYLKKVAEEDSVADVVAAKLFHK